MYSFLSRYHILWFILFCASVFLIRSIPSLGVHLLLIAYSLSYLFFLFPFFIIQGVWKKTWHPLDILLFGIGVYFFFFIPIFYLSTRLGITSLSTSSILIFLSVLIFLGYITTLIYKKSPPAIPSFRSFKIKKDYIILIFFLSAFLLLHSIHFYYYQFIPEWDSYTDISLIEKNLADQTFHQHYRPLFQASASVISALLHISPYSLFVFFFIPIQGVMFIVLYRLFQKYNYTHTPSQIILYLLLLSVPVINMEIDMVRPQNILIIAFPLIFYLSTFVNKKRFPLAFFTLLIITGTGAFYHEFFWFLLLLLPLLYTIEPKIKTLLLSNKKLQIAVLSLTGIAILILISSSQTLSGFILKTSLEVSDFSQWHWWFLSSYNNSATTNTQVGWSGIGGTVKYYAYYASPAIFFLLLLLAIRIKKIISLEISKQKWFLYSLALLVVWFSFAEILPRLNSPFIPERYWLFFDLSVIFLFILTILSSSEKKLSRLTMALLFCTSLIGIAGSVYIASAKKSLTTLDEYATALWLQSHTEPNAIIISQAGNLPLIQNFGKRKLLTPPEDFFLSNSYIYLTDPEREFRLQRIINRLEKTPSPQTKNLVHTFQQLIEKERAMKNEPLYVLYSEQKFHNIYSEREWYQKQNFSNAKLEKFNVQLEKVYTLNGITIWKISLGNRLRPQ